MKEYLQTIEQIKKIAAPKTPMSDILEAEEVAAKTPMSDILDQYTEESSEAAPPSEKTTSENVDPNALEGATLDEIDQVIEKSVEESKEEKRKKTSTQMSDEEAISAIVEFITYMSEMPKQIPQTIDEALKLFLNTYNIYFDNTNKSWTKINEKEIKKGIDVLKRAIMGESKDILPSFDPTNPEKSKFLGLRRNLRLELLDKIKDFWIDRIKLINSKWDNLWEPEEKEGPETSDILSKYFYKKKIYTNVDKLTDEDIQELFYELGTDVSFKEDIYESISDFMNQEPDPITNRLNNLLRARKNPDMWTRVRTEGKPEENKEINYLRKIKIGQRQSIINKLKSKINNYQKKVGIFSGEKPLEAAKEYAEMLDNYMSFVLFYFIKSIYNKKTKKLKSINSIVSRDLDPKNIFEKIGSNYSARQIETFTEHLNFAGFIPTMVEWMSNVFRGNWENNSEVQDILRKGMNFNGLSMELFYEEDGEQELSVEFEIRLSEIIDYLSKTNVDIPVPKAGSKSKKQPEETEPKETPSTDATPMSDILSKEIGSEEPTSPVPPSISDAELKNIPVDVDLKNLPVPPTPVKEQIKQDILGINNLFTHINNIISKSKDVEGDEKLEKNMATMLSLIFSNFYNRVKSLKNKNAKIIKLFEKENITSTEDLIIYYLTNIASKSMNKELSIKNKELPNKVLKLFAVLADKLNLPEDFETIITDRAENKEN